MTSVLNVDTIAAKDGTSNVELTKQIAAKAFYLFDATQSSLSSTDSFNVSSYKDVATGRHAPQWTNTMANDGYSHMSNASNLSALTGGGEHLTTESERFTINDSGSYQDRTVTCGVTHGDLA